MRKAAISPLVLRLFYMFFFSFALVIVSGAAHAAQREDLFGFAFLTVYAIQLSLLAYSVLDWALRSEKTPPVEHTSVPEPELVPSIRPRFERFSSADSRAWALYPLGEYVYVIQDIDVTGYCKIGRTNSPSRRLHRFEVILPFRFQVIHILSCKSASRTESQLHWRFASKRVSGEWFALNAADIEFIRGLSKPTESEAAS